MKEIKTIFLDVKLTLRVFLGASQTPPPICVYGLKLQVTLTESQMDTMHGN